MPQITTLLFDCDNTLVLSEELAFEACAELINRILEENGQPPEVPYTGPKLIVDFVGMNFRGMLTKLMQEGEKEAAKTGKEPLKIEPAKLEQYVKDEEDAVIAKLKAALVPCPGVDAQLEALHASGKYKLAVVSSSAKRRVHASVVKVGQDKYFPEEDIFSAATSLPKPTSKPDPAIYLYAMETLGKTASECVAIEDSRSGTKSGADAGIKVIGYVGPYPDERKAEMEKVLRDAGAVIIMKEWDEFPAALAKIESGAV